jgi:hypothetical protein
MERPSFRSLTIDGSTELGIDIDDVGSMSLADIRDADRGR